MYHVCQPEVHLIAQTQINDPDLDRFLAQENVEQWETDALDGASKLVEVAGRVCYHSYAKPRPGGNQAYIEHILECGHGSVLEHAVFTLLITGVSRNLTHELVRHRAGFAYSQRSTRFVDESEGKEGLHVVPPPLIQEILDWVADHPKREPQTLEQSAEYWTLEHAIQEEFDRVIQQTERSYRILDSMIREYLSNTTSLTGTALRKQAREAARSVLPGCTETKITVTANARALRHFIETRGAEGADREHQRLARLSLRELKEASPVLFGDLEETDSGITTRYRKV